MHDSKIQLIIKSEATYLAESVYELTAFGHLTYLGNPSEAVDAEIRRLYAQAMKSVDKWMQLVTTIQSLEYSDDCVKVELYFPDKTHQYMNFSTISGVDFQVSEKRTPITYVNTSLGKMNKDIIELIVNVPDNPVYLMYDFLAKEIGRVREMLNYSNCKHRVLVPQVLNECRINDPLNICRIASELLQVSEIFKPDGKARN